MAWTPEEHHPHHPPHHHRHHDDPPPPMHIGHIGLGHKTPPHVITHDGLTHISAQLDALLREVSELKTAIASK